MTEVLSLNPSSCIDTLAARDAEDTRRSAKGMGSFCLFDQNLLTADTLNSMRLNTAELYTDADPQDALEALYPASQEACATRSLLAEFDVREKMDGKQFAILAVEGNDPRSVAARRVEAQWFADEFGTHPAEHETSFSPYSESSLFVYMLDMTDPDNPRPCGVLRFVRPSDHGLKTVNILSKDEVEDGKTINPWFNDFAGKIPGFADADTETRKEMIYSFFGANPETTWDVPTMAVDASYKGTSPNDLTTPACGLYAACVNTAMALGAQSFLNTQDYAPLKLMQFRYARLWTDERTKDENGVKGKFGFTPVAYDGPAPVVPSYLADLDGFKTRIMRDKPAAGASLFDPNFYGQKFKLPQDLQPTFFASHTQAA
jgi:hypothetical protein